MSRIGGLKVGKQWHGGKGSQRRGNSDELYQSNWDRIFGGIDYKDENLVKQYQIEKESVSLSPGKNFPDKKSGTLFKSDNTPITVNKSFNNNGENK